MVNTISMSAQLHDSLMMLSIWRPPPPSTAKEFENILNEPSLFIVPQKTQMQQVFNYLLPIIFELENINVSAEGHGYHWPILEKADDFLFRNVVRSVLVQIHMKHREANIPKINASFLLKPGGEKFLHFMWRLTMFVMVKEREMVGGKDFVQGDHSFIHLICEDDDPLVDVKIKMFQVLAIDNTAKFVTKQIEINKMRVEAEELAKELVEKIKSSGSHLKAEEARLVEEIERAPVSAEMKERLRTDYDRAMAEWSPALAAEREESARLDDRLRSCGEQIRRDASVLEAAIKTYHSPTYLDGSQLYHSTAFDLTFGIAEPEKRWSVIPGCQDLYDKLYINNKLDLSALALMCSKTIDLLAAQLPLSVLVCLTKSTGNLKAVHSHMVEVVEYLRTQEPIMETVIDTLTPQINAFYDKVCDKNVDAGEYQLDLSFLDPPSPAVLLPVYNFNYEDFLAPPDPDRHYGLMKTSPPGGGEVEGLTDDAVYDVPLDISGISLGSFLSPGVNTSIGNGSLSGQPKDRIRAIMERTAAERCKAIQAGLCSTVSIADSGKNSTATCSPDIQTKELAPTQGAGSTSDSDVAISSPSLSSLLSLSLLNSSYDDSSVFTKQAIITRDSCTSIRLSNNKLEKMSASSQSMSSPLTPFEESKVKFPPALETSSPLETTQEMIGTSNKGRRLSYLKKSRFPSVPEDSPLSDVSSIALSVFSDHNLTTDDSPVNASSSYNLSNGHASVFSCHTLAHTSPLSSTDIDSLSESEIVNFSALFSDAEHTGSSPLIQGHCEPSHEDTPKRAPPISNTLDLPYTGRPSLDAVINRYHKIRQQSVSTPKFPK